MSEFSFRTRGLSLKRFRDEIFDLLIIGGGITGAGVARDAVSRGLKVALVEQEDFAFGTSSRSSKLIHGGLRYLENMEFGLVFESLSERALLLKTTPHMVRPLPFFVPVYKDSKRGRFMLSLGLWLYDCLALFRTPGFHKGLSKSTMLEKFPALKADGLNGGFQYFDASMWDDMLTVETLRAASAGGGAIANYVRALKPFWEGQRITGFEVEDREERGGGGEGTGDASPGGSAAIRIRAKQIVICAGPWTDRIGASLDTKWRPWLSPSKGIHLIFDLKKLPVPGALVMSHPDDGRISFVIPRHDFGAGVAIVGTTDGPTPNDPEKATIEPSDIDYIMRLLARYFPSLGLSTADIISAYVGVRPLVDSVQAQPGTMALQKVSREHFIDSGPGGVVIAAGGKYTTHRKMAEEIVDFILDKWQQEAKAKKCEPILAAPGPSKTKDPINPKVTRGAMAKALAELAQTPDLDRELIDRHGLEAFDIQKLAKSFPTLAAASSPSYQDPPGFPMLAAELRFAMRNGMVIHLEDFFLRRLPLFLARADHRLPWLDMLAQVWADERGMSDVDARAEAEHLKAEFKRREAWRK